MPKIDPVSQSLITPWQAHVQRWQSGCGSCLCSRAANICFGRGQVPADVLLIGEAPGQSEDARGIVFDGPAGALLDKIVARAVSPDVTTCLANLVGCIPLDDDGNKDGEPDVDSIRKCASRLRELAWICNPKLIVAVGDLARDWLDHRYLGGIKLHLICSRCRNRLSACELNEECDCHEPGVPIPQVAISHPARILRSPVARQGLMRQQATVVIVRAVEQFVTDLRLSKLQSTSLRVR